MSLSSVRPFFRDRLESLGFKEHDEPFQPGIIAANITDGSFHLETGFIASGPANQIVHSFTYPITVRIYRTGFSDILKAYDEVHEDADAILADLLNPSTRLGTVIKDIVPESIQPQALDINSNDNVIILELVFTAKLELCFKP
jgi:hypothetical protein